MVIEERRIYHGNNDAVWIYNRVDTVLVVCRFAFQYNPALQPRAIIVFGCISKSVTDSEIKQMLKILMKVRGSMYVHEIKKQKRPSHTLRSNLYSLRTLFHVHKLSFMPLQ